MDFGYSDRVRQLQEQLTRFMAREIVPRDKEWHELTEQGVFPPPFCAGIKERAREEGLWNMFLPSLPEDAPGTRCTNLEYAPLAEIMGRIYWAPEMFNCNAPDTGNMEVFHMFGTPGAEAPLPGAAAGRQDPLRLLHDRARGRILGRNQRADPHPARGR